MDPITLSVISGALFYVIDRRRKRIAESGAAAPSLESFTLPTIGATEVESFTTVVGPDKTRQFDREVSDGLPRLLNARSLAPISTGPVGRVSPDARVFRVVPLSEVLGRASDTIAAARAEGRIVLASLSIISLSWGADDPMLVVLGGPELRTLVSSPPGVRGDFALLPARVEPAAAQPAAAPTPAAEEPKVVAAEVQGEAKSAPKSKANGQARPAEAPVVTAVAEVKSET